LSTFGWRQGQWPVAEELARTVISLPLYPGLADHAQAYVIDSVKAFYSGDPPH
jgi:dTDP-4-amino-4,6-dideoxygalactose transaminase